MKPEILDSLREARDFPALTRAIVSLCEPFGAVHALRLEHNPGAGSVSCFVELESTKQHAALARALGAARVRDEVSLEIPVAADFGCASRPAPPRGYDALLIRLQQPAPQRLS